MDSVARPLFPTDRPKKSARSNELARRPLRRKPSTHLGLPGVFCVLLLMMMALATIALMSTDCALWEEGDSTWTINAKTKEEIRRFFSDEPLTDRAPSLSWLDFHGEHILGWFGALEISVLAGVVFSLCTYLCMFYDSSIPGKFPPSPISPQRSKKEKVSKSIEYALGYKMVPVNTTVFILISVILLRFYLNLPFY